MQLALQYLLLISGFAATVAVLLAARSETRTLYQSHQRLLAQIQKDLREARALKSDQEAPSVPSAVAHPSRWNAFQRNDRLQVLRLWKRGEDVNHIAAALGRPRREIELLIRVHQLGTTRLSSGSGVNGQANSNT